MRKCYVMEAGWIIEGELTSDWVDTDGKVISNSLEDANVVRSWSNGRGIGGLAKREHRHEYTLDPIGSVRINHAKVLYEFDVEA